MIPNTDFLEALPVAVYTTDAEGRITFFNEAAAELWGHRPVLGKDMWCGSWRIYWPDGTPLPHDQCPMAVALKEGRVVRGVEAIAERRDGTRVPFIPYPTPLKDSSGRVIGGINLLVDVGERKNAEMVAARLAAIVASSDDAIVSKSLDGQIMSWNEGATRILGYEAEEMIGSPITNIIPPELHSEEQQILAKLRRGERIDHYETIRVAKDGRRIDMSLTVSPVRNDRGEVVGASKVGRDITERKQAQKLQQLLIEELNHRVKNTLAMVQAIATQSLRHSKSQGDFVSSFSGRVQALSKAHSLLTQTRMQGAELTDIIREQVMLGKADDNRISYSGPSLILDPQTALHMALVLHELATNARKYGALSGASGQLSIRWETRSSTGYRLHLRWAEKGGPKVSATNVSGFGTALIEQTLRGQGGEASLHYTADGVSCDIDMPLTKDVTIETGVGSLASSDLSFLKLRDNSSDILKGKRLLIIEDEPLVAMDLESILGGAGCHIVGPAGNFDHGKKLIAEETFDAALLDVNLRGQPVDELAAALTHKNVPFAFVTGYGRKALPQAFQEAVLLAKPFTRDQLIAVVEVLLYVGRSTSEVVPFRQKHN